MFTVALIGGDGAGKTTIAYSLVQSSGLPMKYLYMGMSTRSSNHSLPTSRLVLYIKRRIYKKTLQNKAVYASSEMPAQILEYSEEVHGWIWNSARFFNRLAEAWYRQLISVVYRLRGFIVLYDRHYFFDAAPVVTDLQERVPLFDRLYFWIITNFYPKPCLAIFLDASPELLYQRKGEASPKYLSKQRSVFMEQGKRLPHFICVDASKSVDKVISEVSQHIHDFYNLHYT